MKAFCYKTIARRKPEAKAVRMIDDSARMYWEAAQKFPEDDEYYCCTWILGSLHSSLADISSHGRLQRLHNDITLHVVEFQGRYHQHRVAPLGKAQGVLPQDAQDLGALNDWVNWYGGEC